MSQSTARGIVEPGDLELHFSIQQARESTVHSPHSGHTQPVQDVSASAVTIQGITDSVLQLGKFLALSIQSNIFTLIESVFLFLKHHSLLSPNTGHVD